ncbi:MAG TPA: hypothetical protein VJ850_06870, partial [Candidatus Limnocylindrales bacterium]|nr:hypothetical protein [Candidatus Limnocylindrales bacterium]
CGARFVVDAVAWANGTDREPQVSDWRDSEGLPFPDVDVAAIVHDKFADGIILNQTLISGASGLPLYQPSIASLFPGLASEDSLWAVTVLRPGLRCVPDQACPAMFKPDSVIDLVIGPDGRVYEDPEFHTMPLLPGMTPYPPGS